MAHMILATEKLRFYEELGKLCDKASLPCSFCDALWQDLLTYKDLYDELLFYLEQGEIKDTAEVGGETLSDFYVRELRHYNVAHDSGKNGPDCDKNRILLLAVRGMLNKKIHPADTGCSDDGSGMDQL